MKALISKWGNSLAIRLPKAVVDGLRMREGEAVELLIEDRALVIRPARPHYRLEDLIAGITSTNQSDYIDSPPMGDELL
ncbi:MAG: AbrB/MazE/SpoVT family DNA-binding domain-containing protein [Alphaproteobacteria bacterium]|nr:AbrB/MazE/SpoVT family DNA-binding domain-containing protein [Alphaproteobacteria bacterium]